MEYEGAVYELFIPLLSIIDVKKNIDKLCRKMGGCVGDEEMRIDYKETDFGVNVKWGGGC